jgi:acetyl esterase/lipase
MPGVPLASLPEAVRRTMEEIGPVWGRDIGRHRQTVVDAYTPLAARASKEGVRIERELAYGEHPRQRLDVFQPQAARAADVLLFFHGGAYVRGAKSVNGEIYDNVPTWFARQGVLALNVEYRLAPEARYPAGAEDVALAVQWAIAHAGRYGGNPARIFLMGHSAGGTHVGTYALDPRAPQPAAKELAGLILVSARLRADTLADNPNAAAVRAYFGDDPAVLESASPVTHAARCAVPLFIAIAEYENPYLDVYGAELLHRVALARKRAPRFLRLTRHNHTSMVAHFNTGEEILGREILDFMARGE